jgi:uncharacterized protein YkwD
VLALCAALGACAPAPGSVVAGRPPATPPAVAPSTVAPDSPLVPAAPAARVYATGAERDRLAAPAEDPLRAGILEDARAAARRAGHYLPVADARLDWAMTDLARNVRGDDLPALEAVDFLLSHYGIVEPSPHLMLARATVGADDQVRDHARTEIEEILRGGPIARVGVGIDRAGAEVYVAVALQESHLELLAPVPRRLPPGGRTAISVRTDPGFRGPQLVITAPDGSVHEDAPSSQTSRLESQLQCGADGRYQVEIAAAGSSGPAVLANFPVYCGVDPPARSARGAGTHPPSADPDQAERQMVALVNRDRARAGLRPVVADPRLAAIARAHSRDMADHDFVGHVSPRTGTAMDRVHRGGLTPELVLENVGRAYAAEEAESGFLSSPGHRGNLLDPRARTLGVGVVFGPAVTGTRPLFVTQLFTN